MKGLFNINGLVGRKVTSLPLLRKSSPKWPPKRHAKAATKDNISQLKPLKPVPNMPRRTIPDLLGRWFGYVRIFWNIQYIYGDEFVFRFWGGNVSELVVQICFCLVPAQHSSDG